MRDGGTQHKRTALKSVSLQGDCFSPHGTDWPHHFPTAWQWKSGLWFSENPFFPSFPRRAWLCASQQCLDNANHKNTLCGRFTGDLIWIGAITYSFPPNRKSLAQMLTPLKARLHPPKLQKKTLFSQVVSGHADGFLILSVEVLRFCLSVFFFTARTIFIRKVQH